MKPTLADIELDPGNGPKKDSAYLACPVHSPVDFLDWLVFFIERNKSVHVFPDAKKVVKNPSRT